MRVLLTNNSLNHRAGSELYVRDVALELRRRGHDPMVYSPRLGDVADDLRGASIPVTDDLATIRVPPDVIHGQHHLETMTALLSFPGVPAIYVCHGFVPWQERPPRHPRIRGYVAVDETVRERLLVEDGIDPASIRVLHNFVDLARFQRRAALPDAPRRALVFNSLATEENFAAMVREVCGRRGMEVDVVGYAMRRPVREPEKLLAGYDVVFARARSALEAMAVGCAVVVSDPRGMAGLVTTRNYDDLRRRNFGVRTLTQPVTPEALTLALNSYDPAEAARVCDRARAEADLAAVVSAFEELYASALTASGTTDERAETAALAEYLRWLSAQTKSPGFVEWAELRQDLDVQILETEMLRGRLLRAAEEAGALSTDEAVGVLQWELASLRKRLADYESSPFFRARTRLVAFWPAVRLYRWLRRLD